MGSDSRRSTLGAPTIWCKAFFALEPALMDLPRERVVTDDRSVVSSLGGKAVDVVSVLAVDMREAAFAVALLRRCARASSREIKENVGMGFSFQTTGLGPSGSGGRTTAMGEEIFLGLTGKWRGLAGAKEPKEVSEESVDRGATFEKESSVDVSVTVTLEPLCCIEKLESDAVSEYADTRSGLAYGWKLSDAPLGSMDVAYD